MSIIFENIDTGETVSIDPVSEGKYFHAKLSAVINSSNMGTNADRGQDYGYRLQPEQQAIIEDWENDPDMIDKVSTYTKVQLDGLQHADFLAYLLHQQERGKSPERADVAVRRGNQTDYDARVAAIRAQQHAEPVAAFEYHEGATEQPITEPKPVTKSTKK